MLNTEKRNPKTMHIDQMSTLEMVKIINEENENAVKAVEGALPQIVKAIDAITAAFDKGGRLFYIGAGTSGRSGVIDAAECPPTYGVPPSMVIGILAGGPQCMFKAGENEEDNAEKGVRDLMAYDLNSNDIVVGISASGGASYVLTAMNYAKKLGCVTVGVTCNKGCPVDMAGDISVCTDTGPEVITGSTRMKAGTAQKLVLNMFSTCAMVKTGRVYENLMINLKPSNIKLTNRMVGIVMELTDYDRETSIKKLEEYNWKIRDVMEAYKGK